MVGGCIIPRRDSHLLQLYAFLQKLILILAEPLLQPHEPSLRTTALRFSRHALSTFISPPREFTDAYRYLDHFF